MRTVRVKICGITRKEDLVTAVTAGADAIGFVVGAASSPRNLTLDQAGRLMKRVPVFVERVAVTTSERIDFLVQIWKHLRPDSLQMHGQSLAVASALRKRMPNARLIRAVGVKDGNVNKADLELGEHFDAVLLDSFVQGQGGGTGVVHDWELSKRVKRMIDPIPLILAGGLEPENVQEAVRVVQPYAVDVSSGVEQRPGIKDPEKLYDFIRNAKEAAH